MTTRSEAVINVDDDLIREETPIGPDVPVGVEGRDVMREACAGSREHMDPHDTADCAGLDLVEQYEQEEDGGS